MQIPSSLAVLGGAFLLAASLAAQDPLVPTSSITVAPEVVRSVDLDVPPVPRHVMTEPPRHDMPPVPVGPHSWDPPRGPETIPNVPQAVGPAAVVQVHRNNIVTPGGSRSNVGEPSASKTLGGNTILHTGNWYAARSTDNGASWSYINPYTRFAAVDAGFCCDQFTILHAPENMVVWLLQYGFSSTTNKGSIRLATSVGNANTGNPSVSYVVDPSLFGFPAGNWFDYPHMAASNGFVFVASNVFNASSVYQGSIVMRWNAAQMAAGQTANINYFRSDSATAANLRGGSFRFTEGYFGPTTMWWAAHVNTTTLRIYQWRDADGGFSARDRTIGTWYSGRTDITGPDGRGWLGRIDNRITGGFYTGAGNDEIGFLWTSNAGGTFPNMFVRMVKFDANTFDLTGERSYWFAAGAWAYPGADASSSGHVAGAMCFGGGTFYPGTAGWIVDDLNCSGLDNIVFTDANSGPDSSRFGDYVTSQYINGNLWMVTGIAQRDGSGNSNSRPRNAEIGRADLAFPTVYTLTVHSTPVAGANISLTADYTCRPGTATSFTRRFRSGTVVTATAPATLEGLPFARWYLNGAPQAAGVISINVTMSAGNTIDAYYGLAGTFATFGTGCLGSNALRPAVGATGSPVIGQTVTYRVSNALATTPAFMHFGLSNSNWLGIPLPFNLSLIGAPNCFAYVDQVVTMGTATSGGVATRNFTIPFNLAFVGIPHYVQWTLLDRSANQLGLTTSNYIRTTPGSF
jgi:hypothetical protein